MVINQIQQTKVTQQMIVAVMYDIRNVSAVSPDNPDCNRGATVKEIKTTLEEYPVLFYYYDTPRTFEQIRTNIKKSFPILIGIDWATGGGHAVLIVGYRTNRASLREVYIIDPDPTTAPLITIDFADLSIGKYRGNGRWRESFCIQGKK